MKRVFIRICGTAMASIIGILAKTQAFAECNIQATPDKVTSVWQSTRCSSNAINKVCVGGKGRGTSWDPVTGDYVGYCWCRNVSSDGQYGEIACQYDTGSYADKFVTLTGINGCDFETGWLSDRTDATYYGHCTDSTDACYYDSSSNCSKGFSTSDEAIAALSGCCKPCYTGTYPITGLYINGVVHSAAWTVSNNGKTGINTCVYSASSVQDGRGTYVAAGGGSYTCNAVAESATGSGTGSGTGL